MTEQAVILNRLLNKYENSKHLMEPGTSTRRVMLQVEKKELPEYRYEDAAVRDAFNEAARTLQAKQMVVVEWVKGRPLLDRIVLNLANVMACYGELGRVHPKERAEHIEMLMSSALKSVKTPWILAWGADVCADTKRLRVPAICKDNDGRLLDLLRSFQEYDALSGNITMRGFSVKCFSDSKYFERNVQDAFLKVAKKYCGDLSAACIEGDLGEKEQLAFLGIYARPEHYELAGDCRIFTPWGTLDVAASGRCGFVLPSTMVDAIDKIEIDSVCCVTFIENKTNYDEYIASEMQPEELVVYHGGFLSPQKRKLITKILNDATQTATIQFWADIDTGGFRMFQQLQELIPSVIPMRMSGDYVDQFYKSGLPRSKEYLSALREDTENGKYPLFYDAIERILAYGVTIEQEVFLNQ